VTERKLPATDRTRGSGWSMAEWFMGIVGGIALFLGFFVMLGPEDEFIGLGGDLSWRVGDISAAWMFGLLIIGAAMVAGMVAMIVAGRNRVRIMSTQLETLLLHTGVFMIVNAFVWAQDYALGDGLNYAYWLTIPWGIALIGHAVAYFVRGRRHATIAPFETMLKKEAERAQSQGN
jgi:protein-S-isoprenylcysteine O-methyltransferase Ste14